jgi:hypothetical protein
MRRAFARPRAPLPLSRLRRKIEFGWVLCYTRNVQLPVNRRAVAERNRLDEADEAEQYRLETPATRLKSALVASADN